MNDQAKKRKRRRIAIVLMVALVAAWLGSDYLHNRIVLARFDSWESKMRRDENDVQAGGNTFSIERGSTALLLIHGYNDTPASFNQMAPALAERGFSIRAVRLPGFGVPLPQMRTTTSADWIDRVVDEAIRLREKHEKVILVAHSLGGAVGIRVMLEHPGLFDGAVLLAPGIAVADRRSPLLPTRVWNSVSDWFLVFSDVYETPFDRNDAADPAVRNPDSKPPPFTTRNLMEQTFELMDSNRDHASKIQLPLLMILSRNDGIVDWVASEKFFESIGSRRKLLKFYDTSRHALTVDYDWKKIVDDIEVFANSVE